MNEIKRLLVRSLMHAMYDREPELHPDDAYHMALQLIKKDVSVKKLICYIENQYFHAKSFIVGIFSGLIIGLIMLYLDT